MRRRNFIAGLASIAIASSVAARAQQDERMRRIGVLMGYAENDQQGQANFTAFQGGLQKLGWTEGRNIRIDARWAAADADLVQRFAKELVTLQPDLILTQNTPTTAALLQHTRTIPVIFANVSDPVGSGFVASLPRPGGNVTGFIDMEASMAGKWLELLKEVAPRVDGSSMRHIASVEAGLARDGKRRHQRSVNWRSGEQSRWLVAAKAHEPRQIIDDGLHFFVFNTSRREAATKIGPNYKPCPALGYVGIDPSLDQKILQITHAFGVHAIHGGSRLLIGECPGANSALEI